MLRHSLEVLSVHHWLVLPAELMDTVALACLKNLPLVAY